MKRPSLKSPSASLEADGVLLRMSSGRSRQTLSSKQAEALGKKLVKLAALIKVREVMES